ncbi:MAG: hypothetical protein ABI851_07950 [Saprospiraceae bacterium]
MKMTNFKSLPNVFGILLGLILVCLLSVGAELKAQTYGLPLLKSKLDIQTIANDAILKLAEERKQTCTSQDPTAPCNKRIAALMGAYMELLNYIQDQPQLSEYDLLRVIYPITNMHSLAVVPEAVNMSGFNNQQYNIYFIEILDRVKS